MSIIKVADLGILNGSTPAFEAMLNAEQGLTSGTLTLASFSNERFDTDSCYDNTSGNYKFTPTVAGKYFIYTTIRGFSTTDDKLIKMSVRFYKNGTRINTNIINFNQSSSGITSHGLNMNLHTTQEANGSSDYFQVYVSLETSSGTPSIYGNDGTSQDCIFGAYRIIGA